MHGTSAARTATADPTMPSWRAFRDAVVRGSRATDLADACARVWRWRALPDDAIEAAVASTARGPHEATLLQEATTLVRWRLQRDSDPHAARGIEVTRIVDRRALQRFPGSAPVPGDPHQAALLELSVPLLEALRGVGTITTSPAAFERLAAAIGDFERAGRDMTGTSAVHLQWYLGLACVRLAAAATQHKRYASAADAYARAAAHYAAGGDAAAARDARNKAAELATRLAADVDRVTTIEVDKVLAAADPMDRIAATIALMIEAGRSGDRFEAARIAEEASLLLRENGYADPEKDYHAAVDTWLAHAAQAYSGNAVMAHACAIVSYWAAILGARTSGRLVTDPKGSARAERVLRALTPLAGEMAREADFAHRDEAHRLAVWLPQAADAQVDGDRGADGTQRMQDAASLDDALHALRTAANEAPSHALLARADALVNAARAMGSALHVGRALLDKAYLLLTLEQPDAVPALAREAIDTLLAGQAPRLAAFSTGYERELYLMAIAYEARALAAKRDDRAILAMCAPVVRDIERERAKISSPYAQSAFLATRVELYDFAVAGAWRLERWDDVLAFGDLLKSRAVLRGRAGIDANDRGVRDTALRDIETALSDVMPGSREERDLRATRRWLVAARAIESARVDGELPEVSVAAVQAVLGADEAVVSWYDLGDGHALVLAIAHDGVAHGIARAPSDDWRAFVAGALALAEGDRRRARPLDDAIARLGPVLLPEAIRQLLAGKVRLALSPHRALHLFPMHAIAWEHGFLVEAFALRYVPSVTSLLLPAATPADGPMVSVGVARFDDEELPPLPGAEHEARAVAALYGVEPVIDPTRATFAALPLATCRCLHLATHASSVLAGDAVDDPQSARLHLCDGAIDASQLARLSLRADLVVLAACHSGQRAIAGRGLDRLPGDELFGLTGALFEAGATAVLATLWPVRDLVARDVLVRFHRAYAGGARPDDAWRDAIRGYLASPDGARDVFSWATFFVTELGRRSPT